MIEGSFGVWNFQFWDFFRLGNFGRNLLGWLGLIREFCGYSKQSEDSCSDCISWPHNSTNKYNQTCFSMFHLISFHAFWKFLRLRNSAWDFFSFWGVGVGGGGIFGPGIFWGFDFWTPFNHPCQLKSLNKHLYRMHASLKKTPTFYKMNNFLEWTQMPLKSLIGTSWPSQSSCKENSTINQVCPATSVYS